MFEIVNCIITSLRRRNMIKYDMNDLPKLEDKLVKDIISGRVKFRNYKCLTMISTDHHYDALNADIKLRIDHANIGGTFSFLYVQGRDLSYSTSEGFDMYRVSYAITNKKDRPSPLYTLL